jgi:hypothetical protein
MLHNKNCNPDPAQEESIIQPESLYRAFKAYYRATKKLASEIDKAPRLWRDQYKDLRDII